jgi:hypothetical protein
MIRAYIKPVLLYLMHQVIATQGVIWATILSVLSIKSILAEISEPLGHSRFTGGLGWLLASNPFYPLEICVGLWLGWKLFSMWQHHEMFLVWIVPCVVLVFVVLAVPTFTPARISMLDMRNGPLEHYFGWRCPTTNGCIDQAMATLPFYTSVAYSIGALLAYRKERELAQPPAHKNQRGRGPRTTLESRS